MSDSSVVLDPDRLPWLADDHQPRGTRAWLSLLLIALFATLLLAGLSYWLGMQSVRGVDDFIAQPRPSVSQPSSLPGPSPTSPIPADQVPPPAMPDVAPVPEPMVDPAPAAQRPAQPQLPVERAVSPPPSPQVSNSPVPQTAARTGAGPAVVSAKPAAQPRSGVQSRASFNCRLARARWEIAVCNNGDLASLDRDLAALNSDVWGRADAAKRARLARTRDRFIARRNACQSDACTNSAYVARLRELSDIMTGTVARPLSSQASATPSPSAAPARDRPTIGPKATAPRTATSRATASKPTSSRTTSQSAARPRTITQSRASFDCRLARTRGEIAVCNNGNLGMLDRQLALLYSQAWGRADGTKRARLLRTRDRFVARRDACVSEMCTRIAYENRMRQVSDIMFGVDRQQ